MKPKTFYINQSWSRGAFEFNIAIRDHSGILTGVAEPIVWRDVAESPVNPSSEPAFYLKPDECQQLMDELWRVGFRPSEGTGSAGALKQAEEHIKSLQRIAFAMADSGSKK